MAWSESAYARPGPHRPEEEPGAADRLFDPKLLAHILGDAHFAGYTVMVVKLHGLAKAFGSWMDGAQLPRAHARGCKFASATQGFAA